MNWITKFRLRYYYLKSQDRYILSDLQVTAKGILTDETFRPIDGVNKVYIK